MLSIKKSNTKIITWAKSRQNGTKTGEQSADDPFTQHIVTQLQEYMDGKRQSFDLPLHVEGTLFQQAVWNALTSIPYGQTRTYGQIAAMIGKPKAARAVGQALRKNPVCIVVPCHRVTSASGLGGYAYGTAMKRKLLELEGVMIDRFRW